jgi:O-antigen/teichoic acid export membrane protein
MAVIAPILVDHVFRIPAAHVRDAKSAFLLIALSLPAGLVSGSLRGALEASQRFGWVNAVKIPTNAGSYLLPLLGAGLGASLTGIVGLLVALRIATAIIYFLLLAKIYPGLHRWPSWDRAMVRSMLKFGGWVTISNFAWPVFVYLDRMFIGALVSIQAVSYYTAPYEVITRLGVVSGSLWMTIFPAFSAFNARRDRARTQMLFDRSLKYLLISIGAFMVLVIASGRFFMTIWLGEEYGRHCIVVFQILGAGFLADTLANVAFGFLQAIGRADIPARWHVVELGLYVPAVWLLIKAYGIAGAAAAYTLRALFNLVLMMGSSAKIGGLRVFSPADRRLVRAWKILGLMAALVLIGQALGLEDFASVAYTSPIAMAFAVAAWRVILDREERAWVLEKIKFRFGGKAAAE